ncbi:putative protein OS=Streptomyces microflavus OX=1919 GN=Smic_05450 PE=4 SV=1 [Streptomyces microflavus]
MDTDTWLNDHGDVLSLHFFDLPPDLPAALDDGPALRHGLTHFTARAGGGLIEASVKRLGELPLYGRYSNCRCQGQPSGQAFIGSFTVAPPAAPS